MKWTKITWLILVGFFGGYFASRLVPQEPLQLGSSLWMTSVHCDIRESKAFNCKIMPGFTLDNVVTEWYTLYIGNTSNVDDSGGDQ